MKIAIICLLVATYAVGQAAPKKHNTHASWPHKYYVSGNIYCATIYTINGAFVTQYRSFRKPGAVYDSFDKAESAVLQRCGIGK